MEENNNNKIRKFSDHFIEVAFLFLDFCWGLQIYICIWGSRGLMVRESDSQSKGCEFKSRAGRNCGIVHVQELCMYSSLSTFNTTTEVPLSKALNIQLLPGRRSINGYAPGVCSRCVCVCVCVFTAVCVHFGWVKCRARILNMCHHTWLYVTSLSLSLSYFCTGSCLWHLQILPR